MGAGPATFRIRTTSQLNKQRRVESDFYRSLWILTEEEALAEAEKVAAADEGSKSDEQREKEQEKILTEEKLSAKRKEKLGLGKVARSGSGSSLRAGGMARSSSGASLGKKTAPQWLDLEKPYVDPDTGIREKLDLREEDRPRALRARARRTTRGLWGQGREGVVGGEVGRGGGGGEVGRGGGRGR